MGSQDARTHHHQTSQREGHETMRRTVQRGESGGPDDPGSTAPQAVNDFERAIAFLRKTLEAAEMPHDQGLRHSPAFVADVKRALEILQKWENDQQAQESRQHREGRQLRLREVRRANQQLNDEEARAAKVSRLRRGE